MDRSSAAYSSEGGSTEIAPAAVMPADNSAAYSSGDVLPDGTTLIIGNIDPRSEAADRLLDGITMALQEFDTETLLGIAAYRDTLDPEGWMQPLIRGYVEVWR